MLSKVLLIDDLKIVHQLLQIKMASEPIEWYSAFDGTTGLEVANKIAMDLILLDVNLPNEDGLEVCRKLKSNPATAGVPVIFLSGESATDDKVKGFNLGAVDYITKPFDTAELVARIRVALRTKELFDLLSQRALLDGLTRLHNRAYLDERLAAEVAHALRLNQTFSCVMVDIDKFKALNDTYGHPFGDQVLRTIGRMIGQGCRAEDISCRYGGEEFAILTPTVGAAGAAVLAERLRQQIAAESFRHEDVLVKVTCSFGIAEFDPAEPHVLVSQADKALYRAKRAGGNRTHMFDASIPVPHVTWPPPPTPREPDGKVLEAKAAARKLIGFSDSFELTPG